MSRRVLFIIFALGFLATGCPDKKAKYPTCDKDEDCQEGEYCINKKCQQCGPGKPCADGGRCVDGACKAADFCESDTDCPGGQVCKNNKCTACSSDSECGADGRCSNGACLARGACNANEDCADDEDCIDGKCQRPGRNKPPELSCQLEAVFFGFDQYSVEADQGPILERNAECIKQAPGRSLLLNGFTDSRGTEEYNIALSEKRGSAVADYLARLGIDPALLRVVPRGESQASGGDESSFAQDRRVDIEWQ